MAATWGCTLTSSRTEPTNESEGAQALWPSGAVSAGIAGAALAPRGRENEGVAVAVATAVLLAYATFDVRNKAMACVGQTPSGLLEHALIVAARIAMVAMASGKLLATESPRFF